MRKISDRMARTIHSMCGGSSYIDDNYYASSPLNFTSNNTFPLFLKVDVKNSEMDIPIFGKNTILNYIINSLEQSKTINSLIIPFASSQRVHNSYKSADTLIKALAEWSSNFGEMYIATKTNKDELYYGAKGLIFDKDMNLLFLTSIECDIEGTIIICKKAKVYIHPSVFYSDGTVEKCLINKVIPYFLKDGISIREGVSSISIRNCLNYDDPKDWRTYHNAIPQIIVADIKDKFFCKPTLPSVYFNDEDINKFLDENLDAIFNIMKI